MDKIPYNSAEKVILVLDTVVEPMSTGFQTNNNDKYSSLYMSKRVSEIFLHSKSSFNSRNEFALVTLDSHNVHWLCDFTKNVDDLIPSLESLKECNGKYEKYFDLQPIFNEVHQRVTEDPKLLEDYIVRIILLYTRSNIIPRFDLTDSNFQELIENPNFYFDLLYLHESDCQKNKCEEIFSELKTLDVRNTSYIMEVSRDARELHKLMGRFLAHPKQRVPLKLFNDSIHPSILKLAEAEIKRRNQSANS